MRHRKKIRSFKRSNGFQKMLYLNLLKSLFLHGSIKTTLKKGKILSSLAGKVFGKISRERNIILQKRYLFSVFRCSNVFSNVFNYKKKAIILLKCLSRFGDSAPMVLVKLE